MLEISSNRYDNRWRRVDIESLMIGDRLGFDLTQAQLFSELTKINCPRIMPDMGRHDLLFCYGVHLQELAERRRAEAAAK